MQTNSLQSNPPGKQPTRCLTFAGSDPTGGAGLQADLATFAAFGCLGSSVVTVLTAQSSHGLSEAWPLAPHQVRNQWKALQRDPEPGAIKVGMLANRAVAEPVLECLRETPASVPVIWDPLHGASHVLKASDSGWSPEDAAWLRQHFFERAHLCTPNQPEAAWLLGWPEERIRRQPEAACLAMRDLGARAVLLKGGHAEANAGQLTDRFLDEESDAILKLPTPYVATQNTHGTGCALSAAIAAGLALGCELRAAVQQAQTWLNAALCASRDWGQAGEGRLSPDHFHRMR